MALNTSKKGVKKMDRNRNIGLIALLLVILCWTVPAYGLVIEGPALTQTESGVRDLGLLIRAESDTILLSVDFPNQGLDDVILLRRNSDKALLASIQVPAGNNNAKVNIGYPLAANEIYELIATTPNNKYYGAFSRVNFPVANSELTILSSFIDRPVYTLWLSFNNITTGTGETEIIEAVIDIKPGSDINPINLKSKGLVPVAILTTDDLDALTVDLNSIIFAGATPVKMAVQDIDGDGSDDILLHFKTAELSDLSADSTEAVLTGVTLDSAPFSGQDSVIIVPKK